MRDDRTGGRGVVERRRGETGTCLLASTAPVASTQLTLRVIFARAVDSSAEDSTSRWLHITG